MAAAVSSPPRVPERIVLTGPSGWIGQALLAYLARSSGGDLAGRVTAFASSGRQQRLASGGTLAIRPLASITAADTADAHVIHLAYLTKEKAEILGERAFTDANLAIDDLVLRAIADGVPRSVFIASSGAAQLAASGRDLHPYGLAKLRQEQRFLEVAAKSGAPALAGRIFNLAGPYINKLESYALSNFVQQALVTGRIRIAAAVPVFRSFLHVEDLAALVCAAAVREIGRSAPLDLCGGEVVEMADLADAVVHAMVSDVAVERGSVDLSRPSLYLGNFADTRVLAMEAAVPLAKLGSQVDDTISWIRRMSVSPPIWREAAMSAGG